jgi:hypothetical protein
MDKPNGPKTDEVTGGWRKLHNEELHNLYSSPSIIRISKSWMRWAGHVARMGRKGMHIGYWWESSWKEPTGKTKAQWMDNIKMDLREIGWDGRDWIGLVQDRDQWRALVYMVMNLWVP